jgi:transposase
VRWNPFCNVLEDGFTLILPNTQRGKQVPVRTIDIKDCEWIAGLLRHGLLRASYMLDQTHRELWELTRYRTSLVRERATEVNRLQKVPEGGNLKLGYVATDVLGVSGRAMLEGLAAGETDSIVPAA